MESTWNGMGIAVRIWDKYNSCCIGNGRFHSALPREIFPISNTINTHGTYQNI